MSTVDPLAPVHLRLRYRLVASFHAVRSSGMGSGVLALNQTVLRFEQALVPAPHTLYS
jgi:hypothetical protein